MYNFACTSFVGNIELYCCVGKGQIHKFFFVRDPGELGGSATKGRDEESEVGAGRLLVV